MTFYDRIVEIQNIAWRDDDRMDQETLEELQDKLADFALSVAEQEGRVADLVKEFPWLYEK